MNFYEMNQILENAPTQEFGRHHRPLPSRLGRPQSRQYVPQVQYRTTGKGKLKGRVAGSPSGREEKLGAIIFQTDTFPVEAKADEVIWNSNFVDIKNAKEIGHRLAISILKNTPYGHLLKWNDGVEYV